MICSESSLAPAASLSGLPGLGGQMRGTPHSGAGPVRAEVSCGCGQLVSPGQGHCPRCGCNLN